jgi:hypothetical protein
MPATFKDVTAAQVRSDSGMETLLRELAPYLGEPDLAELRSLVVEIQGRASCFGKPEGS